MHGGGAVLLGQAALQLHERETLTIRENPLAQAEALDALGEEPECLLEVGRAKQVLELD